MRETKSREVCRQLCVLWIVHFAADVYSLRMQPVCGSERLNSLQLARRPDDTDSLWVFDCRYVRLELCQRCSRTFREIATTWSC